MVSLLPVDLVNPLTSLRGTLEAMKLAWNPELGGVIMAFKRVALREPSGQLNNDEPHVHVRATATARVFTPQLGQVLLGTISEVSATHLSLLAYENFNATIRIDKTRFALATDGSGWTNKADSGASPLEAGSTVEFMVTGMHHAEGLLSLDGEVVGAESSSSSKDPVSPAPHAGGKSDHSNQKRSRASAEDSQEEDKPAEKKKSKKHKEKSKEGKRKKRAKE